MYVSDAARVFFDPRAGAPPHRHRHGTPRPAPRAHTARHTQSVSPITYHSLTRSTFDSAVCNCIVSRDAAPRAFELARHWAT